MKSISVLVPAVLLPQAGWASDSDSAAAEKALVFDPTRLTDGIELSDDPLPALRSCV